MKGKYKAILWPDDDLVVSSAASEDVGLRGLGGGVGILLLKASDAIRRLVAA